MVTRRAHAHLGHHLAGLALRSAERRLSGGQVRPVRVTENVELKSATVQVAGASLRHGSTFSFSVTPKGRGSAPYVSLTLNEAGRVTSVQVNPKGLTWGVIPEFNFARATQLGGAAAFDTSTLDYRKFAPAGHVFKEAEKLVAWDGNTHGLEALVRATVRAAKKHAKVFEELVDRDVFAGPTT